MGIYPANNRFIGFQIAASGVNIPGIFTLGATNMEEIQQPGDHESLNWIITLGVIDDKPAEIVDALDAQSQVSFKVFAIWE